ncbi:MAG: geranylgeranylglycerol-phosphate geranylgeranyltransferase [Bacteroidota bacterium]
MAYLRVLRPLNLLLIVMVQAIIKYGLLEVFDLPLALGDVDFTLLSFATICIAAGGNVVNDIMDKQVDSVNKPEKMIVWKHISERAAYNYYIVLNVLGVGAGFFLANRVGHPGLAAVFIVISVLLYSYATQIKGMLLLGNILVSALVAMSLLVLILFDIYPAMDGTVSEVQLTCTRTILAYAGFAFFINLIREIVKDLQDIDGDKNGGRSSLPIVLGRSRTTLVTFVMGVVALLTVLIYTYQELYRFTWVAFYAIFLIAAPLLYFCIKAWNAETKKDFKRLSLVLKLVMFTGVASLIFYAEIIPLL